VDGTFASPVNFRPLEHGADIVITSATKYLNGHSDVIAGAVAGSASLIEEVIRLMTLWGQAIDPHTAWLIDRGIRTLEVRMARHNENGMAVAQWASQHPGHSPGALSRIALPSGARTGEGSAERVRWHGRARDQGRRPRDRRKCCGSSR
jgi:O-acetylhomoserine/O-acetylserine sulfhydrylase-like pyridoxal-dependent enzyme